uniref:Transposase n=1 Tax=Strongyloides venezuelensis TaxID=75913 RepID=A0A0K0FUP1_STRVS
MFYPDWYHLIISRALRCVEKVDQNASYCHCPLCSKEKAVVQTILKFAKCPYNDKKKLIMNTYYNNLFLVKNHLSNFQFSINKFDIR